MKAKHFVCERRLFRFLLLCLCYAACNRAAAALPDLIVDRDRLARTVLVENRTFTSEDCANIEGCMPYVGTRKLLRFAVAFVNMGRGDLVIGDPTARSDFVWSPCHGHYHFMGVATYALINSSGVRVRSGTKTAFCLLDYVRYADWARTSKNYTCNYQGISAGWADVYSRFLDCQWLDVTGLKGTYTLRVNVNPYRKFAESNYSNNSVSVQVTIY